MKNFINSSLHKLKRANNYNPETRTPEYVGEPADAKDECQVLGKGRKAQKGRIRCVERICSFVGQASSHRRFRGQRFIRT